MQPLEIAFDFVLLAAAQTNPREQLSKALAAEDLEAVRVAVAEARRILGDRAGVPEVPDTYLAVPTDGRWLTAAEADGGFERLQAQIDKVRWWKIGLDPTQLDHALREPAAVVSGCVHAHRAKLTSGGKSLHMARDAGDFLIWAQQEAATGGFPFPAFRGVAKDNAFASAVKYLKQAEKDGRLDQVVRKGWAFEDAGDGGLQFDNGEAGVALFELYEATKDGKYLDSANRAAEWAAGRPLVPNWNYNSFSVDLLAKAFEVTGNRKHLATAIRKARVGVIPGQLIDGPRAGRWIDRHNARPAYHYIILRSLARLVAVLPQDDPSRPEIVRALKLGLKARNVDFRSQGVPTKDKAAETLILVHRAFAGEPEFLRESLSTDALDALGALVSEQARRGGSPLGPREWGMFLEHVVRR